MKRLTLAVLCSSMLGGCLTPAENIGLNAMLPLLVEVAQKDEAADRGHEPHPANDNAP